MTAERRFHFPADDDCGISGIEFNIAPSQTFTFGDIAFQADVAGKPKRQGADFLAQRDRYLLAPDAIPAFAIKDFAGRERRFGDVGVPINEPAS